MAMAETQMQADRRRAGLVLGACSGVHAVQDGLSSTVNVLLPILAQSLGLSYAQVGVVKAANLVAMGVLEIPSGFMSERWGARILLAFGLAVVGLGYLWLAQAAGFSTVLFSLSLAGVGAAFQHTLSSAVIAAAFEGPGRRPALGTYNAAGDVGKLAMTGLFTLLIGLGVGWRAVTFGYGVIGIVLAILVIVLLTRAAIGGPPRRLDPGETAAQPLGWGLRSRRAFMGLTAINFLDTMVQSGFLTFVAFLMIERGAPLGLAGLAVVLTLAGGVVGKFCCGFLARRMGIVPSLVLVEVLTVASILAVVAAPIETAYLLLPLLGVFLQGSSSITYATVADIFDGARQARGFSLIYTTSTIAAIVAALAFGLISETFGLEATMLTMAGLIAATLVICPALGRGLAEAGA